MKHGKKPTYEQRKTLERLGLDSQDWLIVKNTSTELVVVHRVSNDTKTFYKGGDFD